MYDAAFIKSNALIELDKWINSYVINAYTLT